MVIFFNYKMIIFELSYRDIISIKELIIPSDVNIISIKICELSTLDGIENFIELKELTASYNKIKSISNIKNLINLESIIICHNQIRSIVKMKNLINLTRLHISYNKIVSIECLKYLVNLKDLYLRGNKIKSLLGIEKLVNLTHLYINNNKIKSLNELKYLINLECLSISNNYIKSLFCIKNLYKLKEVCFKNNLIRSVVIFSEFTSLYDIYSGGNPLVPCNQLNLIKYIGNPMGPHAGPYHRSAASNRRFGNAWVSDLGCGVPDGPTWVLTYNYWQVKKYPQHLKKIIFDYYKMYFINQYKEKLIKGGWWDYMINF